MIALTATYVLMAFLAVVAIALITTVCIAWVHVYKEKERIEESMVLGTVMVLIFVFASLAGIIVLAKEMGL